jgi:hypothetical protein
MVYSTKYNTTEQYNAVKANLIKPHVALTLDDYKCHYSNYDPYNGHEYVEIGGLKWATMNVGATSETDYGLFFQWGDTQGYTADQVGNGEGKKAFNWPDYKYCNGSSSPGATGMTKYNSADGKTVLDLKDDAARVNWGGAWRIPTTEDIKALGAAVSWAWTANYQDSGVAGLVCTDKTDSSKVLFFPACGNCYSGSVHGVGTHGSYWTSSLYSSIYSTNVTLAYLFSFNSGHYGINWQNSSSRNGGYSVRPVIG